MTSQEIIAKHDELHLNRALERVKIATEKLSAMAESLRLRFPKSDKAAAIAAAVESVKILHAKAD